MAGISIMVSNLLNIVKIRERACGSFRVQYPSGVMPLLPYLEHAPSAGEDVQMAEDAYVLGKVSIAGPARLGPSAVVRGDQSAVTLGSHVRLGERATIHVEATSPTVVGDEVWIGADVVVHGCTLGDRVRVEDGAAVLSRSSIGSGSWVAAGSLVPEGAHFPERSYLEGVPARRLRDTTPEEVAETTRLARGGSEQSI